MKAWSQNTVYNNPPNSFKSLYIIMCNSMLYYICVIILHVRLYISLIRPWQQFAVCFPLCSTDWAQLLCRGEAVVSKSVD